MTDYKILSDAELVALLRASDPTAFREILQRYSGLLINFVYRRLGDLPLAEDMVSDVWADIWEKKNELELELDKGLEPFIFTVVKNRILDYHKHQKVSQKYIDSFQKYLSTEYNKTDHLVRENDLRRLIEFEIAALPENMRKVFLLNRKTDMTRKEIATYLNMPENSVKSNMQRALRFLRLQLNQFLSISSIYLLYLVFEL